MSLSHSCWRYISYPPLQRRHLSSFCWSGPRNLKDVLKKELLIGKSRDEVSNLWLTYHEGKDQVQGSILTGPQGLLVLERAKKSPFFIHPIFRDNGYIMLLSQFQPEQHFLVTFLEDYKTDPAGATPILTCSFYVDYAQQQQQQQEQQVEDALDLTMVRTEIIAQTIQDHEAKRVVQNIVNTYHGDDNYTLFVHSFNHSPNQFNFENYMAFEKEQWKE